MKDILESGLIGPSISPWALPVVMVPKSDGSLAGETLSGVEEMVHDTKPEILTTISLCEELLPTMPINAGFT